MPANFRAAWDSPYGQSISLFVTRRVPFARRGWVEHHVDGAELYFASLRGVTLIW